MMMRRPPFRPNSPQFLTAAAATTVLLFALYQLTNSDGTTHNHALNGADYIAYSVCHRLPTHSFAIFGRPLPLCARCSGIYLGVLLALSMTWLTGRQRHAQFPPRIVIITLLALFLTMAFDGSNSFLHDIGAPHLYEPNNILRLITGFGAGLAVAAVTTTIFAQTAWTKFIWKPQLDTFHELLMQLALAVALILLILSNQPTILYVLALGSALGVLLVLSLLYTTLVLTLTRRDGTIQRYRQLILPVLLGFGLACGQIITIATLRFNLTGTWSGF